VNESACEPPKKADRLREHRSSGERPDYELLKTESWCVHAKELLTCRRNLIEENRLRVSMGYRSKIGEFTRSELPTSFGSVTRARVRAPEPSLAPKNLIHDTSREAGFSALRNGTQITSRYMLFESSRLTPCAVIG
jgi:hypothetical protein